MPGQSSFPGMQPSQMTVGQPVVQNLGVNPQQPVNPQSSYLQTQIWPPPGGMPATGTPPAGTTPGTGIDLSSGPLVPLGSSNLEAPLEGSLKPVVIQR